MMFVLLILAQTPVQVTNIKASTTAIATRCVNASGTAFESCGGLGAAVHAGNSSTTPLGIGATFTGSAIDMLDYSTLRISVYASTSSAVDGWQVQFSNDGVNWDFIRKTNYVTSATGGNAYAVYNRVARYARVVFINGGVAQAAFRLQTMVVPNSSEFARNFLSELPVASSGAIVAQSIIHGVTTAGGGAYVTVKVNPSGALTVDATQATSPWVVTVASHPSAVVCQMAAATTTTLVELAGCAASAGNSYYVTSLTMTGGIATAATVPALLRSGTGTNCATATATWYTCWHGTAGGCMVSFPTPIKVTAGHALCAIDATVGTKSVMLTGYLAP